MVNNDKKVKMSDTQNMITCGFMAAIMCILAPIAIPFPGSPVPVSLGAFVIYVAAFLLRWKYCLISYIIYLLLGMVGLPVFSGYNFGLAVIMGPTGGYLIGFIFIAIICGYTNERFSGKGYMQILGMVLGLICSYLIGTIWFSYQQSINVEKALMICVYPFIIIDIIKIIAASIIGPELKKRVNIVRRRKNR